MSRKTTSIYICINILASFCFIYFLLWNNKLNFILPGANVAIVLILNIFYALTGTFLNPVRKSRLKEFVSTLNQSLILMVVYLVISYLQKSFTNTQNIANLFYLGFYHLIIVYSFRLAYLTLIKRLLQNQKIGFNTIVLGNNHKASAIYNEITNQKKALGFKILGFVTIDNLKKGTKSLKLKNLGSTDDLLEIIENYEVEEVIIALETSQHHQLKSIFDKLESSKVIINIIPDTYDIVSGFVKIDYLFSIPLITLNKDIMPFWQRMIKRGLDYLISVTVLIIFFPVLIAISILIKLTSKGSAIYSQERIGKNGYPFQIYKFRTMYKDAEPNGPQLSKTDDNRITKVGNILRKLRLDELPQFINVLKGEMSIVGPRPERQFYIDCIIEKAPHYYHLQKVLPGITSWGQVKFGYAENIDQMIKRLTFDIIYIKNRSLALDFKIMFYTFIIILQGRGK